MNQQAAALGMKNSHFTDSTGLPHPDHYSTASDLAILARALIVNFPEYYHYFSQKWFTYNNIKQKNRNRLLWRDPRVDGLKTGYTESAGYCLAASAKEKQMRLISLVMGAKSPQARTQQTEVLLDYGFRYYDGYTIYKAGQTLISPRIWGGTHKTTAFGVAQDVFVTIPKNAYKDLSANVELNPQLAPPIVKGKAYGTVTVTLNGETLARQPLIALQDNPRGSFWRRISDSVSQTFSDDEDETKPTAATS